MRRIGSLLLQTVYRSYANLSPPPLAILSAVATAVEESFQTTQLFQCAKLRLITVPKGTKNVSSVLTPVLPSQLLPREVSSRALPQPFALEKQQVAGLCNLEKLCRSSDCSHVSGRRNCTCGFSVGHKYSHGTACLCKVLPDMKQQFAEHFLLISYIFTCSDQLTLAVI